MSRSLRSEGRGSPERARGPLPSGARAVLGDIEVAQGDVVGGRYQLLEERGRGGVGVVWRAIDGKTQSHVAVKLLNVPASDGRGAGFADRFRRAARALHDVNHPGIVRVLDVQAEGEPGLPYIVLEWLQGRSWREQRDAEEFRDFDNELAILLQVADALAALHAAKIAHRDIKPDNIFLSRTIAPDGDTIVSARLIDFDLVKVREGRAATETRTVGLGTVDYMAPEQFEGGDVDARVDVWALGVLLFEILVGRKPFEGRVDYEVAAKVIRDPVPSIDHLSGGIDSRLLELCRSLLEKSPTKRPEDGAARTCALLSELLRERGARITDRLPPDPDGDACDSSVKQNFKTAMSMHWLSAGGVTLDADVPPVATTTPHQTPAWAVTAVATVIGVVAIAWGAVRAPETVRPSRIRIESNVAGAEVFVGGTRKGAISASNHAATVELDAESVLHNLELRCGSRILDSASLDFADPTRLPLIMRVGGEGTDACNSSASNQDAGVSTAETGTLDSGPAGEPGGAPPSEAGMSVDVPWAACVGRWIGYTRAGSVSVSIFAAPDSSGAYIRLRDAGYSATGRSPPAHEADGWHGRASASDWSGSFQIPCTGAGDDEGRYSGPDGAARLRRAR